jgi:hypothetical protein
MTLKGFVIPNEVRDLGQPELLPGYTYTGHSL